MIKEIKAATAYSLSIKSRQRDADGADMSELYPAIQLATEAGKFSLVVNGVVQAQVYKLHQLGYTVEWNGPGSFATISWQTVECW